MNGITIHQVKEVKTERDILSENTYVYRIKVRQGIHNESIDIVLFTDDKEVFKHLK